jgi:DNA-binding HxlR family transcriptional regulator
MAHPSNLLALFHHRWAVPMMAELHRDGGCRFATLKRRLGIPRETLRATLAYLITAEFVRRNPGYGHPVRPEYVLCGRGVALGPDCTGLVDVLETVGMEGLCMTKWPLPVLLAVDGREARFGEVSAILLGVSPRALTLALGELVEMGLLDRRVVDSRPPGTRYSAVGLAIELLPTLKRMAGGVGAG